MAKAYKRLRNGALAPTGRELEARDIHARLKRAVRLEKTIRVLARQLRTQVAVTDEALEDLGITMKTRADRLAHEQHDETNRERL